MSIIGMVFMTTGTLWCLVIAVFAFSFGRRLNRSSHAAQQLRRASDILFILSFSSIVGLFIWRVALMAHRYSGFFPVLKKSFSPIIRVFSMEITVKSFFPAIPVMVSW